MERLLLAAIPFPLTDGIRRAAMAALNGGLVDKGGDESVAHDMPNQAATQVTQAVISKYLGKDVSADFIRQGASHIAPTARPSDEVLAALAQERQDPEHKMRDLALQTAASVLRADTDS
jgi:hypothetical protein